MDRTLLIIGSACLLTAIIFVASLLPLGERPLGPIENIHGIPYPKHAGTILVTEELAHTDVYLKEPVLGKKLRLAVDFEPGNLTSLSVGVREDSFWLSYGDRQEFFSTTHNPVAYNPIYIPLTDKLQEADRSIDLMFFAQAPPGEEPLWELHDIKAKAIYAKPTYAQFRDYIRSVLKRERAL